MKANSLIAKQKYQQVLTHHKNKKEVKEIDCFKVLRVISTH